MNFLLNNFTSIATLITALVACGSFLLSLYKWLDSRNRELSNQRYLQYRELIRVICACDGEAKTSPPEQLLCIILLKEFKEYYKTTREVFSDPQIIDRSNSNWKKYILPKIQKVLKEIEQEQKR